MHSQGARGLSHVNLACCVPRRSHACRRSVRDTRTRTTNLAVTLAITTAVAVAGCGASSTASSAKSGASSSSPPMTSVSMQWYGGTSLSIEEFVAQKEGFFQKNHLNVKMINIASSAGALSAIAGGSVDVISASPEAVLSAIQKGLPLKLISGSSTIIWQLIVKGNNNPTNYPESVMALKGKTLGVTALGSSGQDLVESVLETAGLFEKAVSYVGTGAPATAVAALESGKVQATLTYEPITYIATKDGKAQSVLDLRKGRGLPSVVHCCDYIGLFAGSSFAQAHPDVVHEIQRSMAEAYVWITDPANEKGMEQLANEEVGNTVAPAAVKDFTSNVIGIADAEYSKQAMQGWIDFDVKFGLLPKALSVDSLFAPGVPQSVAQVRSLAK